MATLLCGFRSALRSPTGFQLQRRTLTTLQNNPHIYVFPSPITPNTNILTLLPTTPPTPSLALGTSPSLPPTPDSLTENPHFLTILQSVISEHAASDPDVQSQAQVMASTAGANLGSGGVFFAPKSKTRRRGPTFGSAGATGGDSSGQGGAGGAGRGGFIHVSDARNPPEYGRIAWPEDIFGSLEVDGQGNIEGNGNYQPSGTYRLVTRNGILGLSPFLRGKLVERLRLEEQALQK